MSELSAAGHFALPSPRSRPSAPMPRRSAEPVAPLAEVADTVGSVRGLRVVLVDNDEQRRLWNTLMHDEHPRGAGPLVGAQLRYLIGSAHGWLGGFGFSAAALALRDRDAWIGWDANTRRAQLHRVLGMSRFLLRPQGCKNLASTVLGRVLRRVADDFEQRFGYRPYLVESFVDTAMFDGACYRAANFLRIGQTQGRGRQDRLHAHTAGRKAIYVYPLLGDFREQLGVVAAPQWTPLAAGEGLDSETWAIQEFGDAPLGDSRLSQRLVASAARLAEQPGRAFTGVAQSDAAAIKGYYRLIDKPDLDAVTMANILAPHQARTLQRMANEARVLCVSDGTTLDYSGLAECEGLGNTGSNQTGAISRGIQMHSTLAINGDGIPLGIVDVRCRTPQGDAPKRTASTPIEDKKSYDWVVGLRSCMDLAEQLPDTRITCVMDREADFFELFDAHRDNPCVDLLIRAKHNRQTDRDRLFDRLRDSTPQGRIRLEVKRQSARPKRSKQKARPARAARIAELELRYEQVEFAPPSHLKDKAALSLWVVHAREHNPPEETKPLEWCLLTSREMMSAGEAEQCLADYALRWRIEDWHRVLKTGCRVEELAHQTVDRLERAIAINLVIAWRLMVLTLLGREVPDLPAQILFSEVEIQVLSAWAKNNRAKPPATLGSVILLVARIGGYTNRNNDPPPGHELMWYGYQNLNLMCMGYELREA
ncbi:MAG: IS4 family transposase [Sedimenticolaceae bacterium]